MRGPFIYLRPEVTRDDALAIINWLQNEQIRQYLSDTQDASMHLRQVVDRVNLPVLTHLFSRDGRFYMVHDKAGALVGFVRLVVSASGTEMVIVIGDQRDWGRRLGTSTIAESMKIAFFELRTPKMTARIYHENKRSLRAFLRAGFRMRRETPAMKVLEITMEEYIQSIQQGGTHMASQVIITAVDQERLKKVMMDASNEGSISGQTIQNLERELSRARVMDSKSLPPKVITMHSKVLLRLDEEEMEVDLVYPKEADWASNRLSVLSPIGTAILGYSEGDRIVWDVPSGMAEIQIKKVLYQPEAAGDYDL